MLLVLSVSRQFYSFVYWQTQNVCTVSDMHGEFSIGNDFASSREVIATPR